MQKNDLSVFSFNLNWRETPDEFVASDVVPSGKHLSHKLRTGANAYEHDHSEFLMWPQCKKAFGLSISISYVFPNAMKQVDKLVVWISPSWLRSIEHQQPKKQRKNVPGIFFLTTLLFQLVTITICTCFFRQNSLNNGLMLQLWKYINGYLSLWKHESRKDDFCPCCETLFEDWTQQRNMTSTLQTRAAKRRHMLTHPWDWANAPLTLIAKLHTWCICKMLLWIDNATNDLLNQDFFRSTFSSELIWV